MQSAWRAESHLLQTRLKLQSKCKQVNLILYLRLCEVTSPRAETKGRAGQGKWAERHQSLLLLLGVGSTQTMICSLQRPGNGGHTPCTLCYSLHLRIGWFLWRVHFDIDILISSLVECAVRSECAGQGAGC